MPKIYWFDTLSKHIFYPDRKHIFFYKMTYSKCADCWWFILLRYLYHVPNVLSKRLLVWEMPKIYWFDTLSKHIYYPDSKHSFFFYKMTHYECAGFIV